MPLTNMLSVLLDIFFLICTWYAYPSSRDRTPQCTVLHYQVLAIIDHLVEYKYIIILFGLYLYTRYPYFT